MEHPTYIVIVRPRNPSIPSIWHRISATIAYSHEEAEQIAEENSDEFNECVILYCDYSMRDCVGG